MEHTENNPCCASNLPPVLDISIGLQYCAGSASIYRKVLQSFLESAERMERDFLDAEAKSDTQTLYRLAHSLKSISGTIGAMQCSQNCENLCVSIKNTSPYSNGQLDPVLKGMKDAIPLIQQYLSE